MNTQARGADHELRHEALAGPAGAPLSFLVNGVAVYAAIIAAALGLGAAVGHSGQWPIAVVILAVFAWFAWALVGTTRAGIATLRNPASSWAHRLGALVVFICLAAAVYGIASDLAFAWRWMLGVLRG